MSLSWYQKLLLALARQGASLGGAVPNLMIFEIPPHSPGNTSE